jgi:hypothetical protein
MKHLKTYTKLFENTHSKGDLKQIIFDYFTDYMTN